jgi:hypothetical protein
MDEEKYIDCYWNSREQLWISGFPCDRNPILYLMFASGSSVTRSVKRPAKVK